MVYRDQSERMVSRVFRVMSGNQASRLLDLLAKMVVQAWMAFQEIPASEVSSFINRFFATISLIVSAFVSFPIHFRLMHPGIENCNAKTCFHVKHYYWCMKLSFSTWRILEIEVSLWLNKIDAQHHRYGVSLNKLLLMTKQVILKWKCC